MAHVCRVLLIATLFVVSAFSGAEPTSFQVHVDISQVPNAEPYIKPTQELIRTWYPKINAILFGKDFPLPLNDVQVVFEPKSYFVNGANRVEVPAYEEQDVGRTIARIHVNFSHLQTMKDSYRAMLIHELTHVNQQYRNPPSWLNEGIADYIRHKYFEGDIELKLPVDEFRSDRQQMKQAKLRKHGYLQGYTIAASFLFWMEERKTPGLVVVLNQALRNGRYSATIFRQRCGASLDALWTEFMAQSQK